jgi:predicted short-subunit dehydrogenase-like oxidoreductase (DUF2520 family)
VTARRVRIVGPGRAGGAFSLALARSGWTVLAPVRRGEPVAGAGDGADLVLIATPDAAIAAVAASIASRSGTVVAHCSGATPLDALAPHPRRASVHPVMTLPSAEDGAARLRAGGWFAIGGDPLADDVVAALGGRAVRVPEDRRVLHHAAATIAANHLVALLGQVERVAAAAEVPVQAYLDLAEEALANVRRLGAAAALTGPVARGDWGTVERHRAALADAEREGYDAMARLAARLGG